MNTRKFFDRKLKHSTDTAIRQQRKAKENLILSMMQLVKWVVGSKQGSPLKTKIACSKRVIPHPKFWKTGST